MTVGRYATPPAFKQALEQRLRSDSTSGTDFARRRQLLVFDRFLARLTQTLGDAVTLKGGLVLELRLARARTTKDVDLRMLGSPAAVLERLQEAARLDLRDFMRFEVQLDRLHPDIQGDGMKYDGYRFRAECRLAGKVYGRPFGVDVAFGDPLVQEPDVVVANDVLAFAGIEPPTLRIYPVVSHIAEKLHAYTMPRRRPNSRVKDLPDLALLGSAGELDAEMLRAALGKTFAFRETHPVPEFLQEPPDFWELPYAAMATTDELAWGTLSEVHSAAAAFLDPVLAGSVVRGMWVPDRWSWRDR
jgi:hypothetical protein